MFSVDCTHTTCKTHEIILPWYSEKFSEKIASNFVPLYNMHSPLVIKFWLKKTRLN